MFYFCCDLIQLGDAPLLRSEVRGFRVRNSDGAMTDAFLLQPSVSSREELERERERERERYIKQSERRQLSNG